RLSLQRIGAVRLLILRVLGGVLTHSNYATGVALTLTARRPPRLRRVFPTGSDRAHSTHHAPLLPEHSGAPGGFDAAGEPCRTNGWGGCDRRWEKPLAVSDACRRTRHGSAGKRPPPTASRSGAA